MKRHVTTIILIVILLAGLSLLLYPSVSNYWNSLHQTRAVIAYAETVANMDEEDYERLWNEATSYNQELAKSGIRWTMTDEERAVYDQILNVGASGMMSYIEIPRIGCSLPIYHDIEESVLQTAIGHIAGSSLPVGGESTHCLLAGHRGLPSAKLFTDLDKLEEGDKFMIRTLNEVLTYQIDRIWIVEPTDLSDLQIVEGMDYCTLVTCTPYGINSHRLLIRGHRVETTDPAGSRVTADAIRLGAVAAVPFVGIPLILLLLIFFLMSAGGRKMYKKMRKKPNTKGPVNTRRRGS